MLDTPIMQFVTQYGYFGLAGVVGLESMGIPLPGETTLIATAIIAASTHSLDIGWIVAAAALGAIIGDNIGFWIGREFGYRLLRRYGKVLRVSERRIKVGQYLFARWGGWVVFLGRFVAVLRAWAALLAGINRMHWWQFVVFNAAGGVIWASAYGFGAYYLGKTMTAVAGPVGIGLGVLALSLLVAGVLLFRRFEKQLEDRAERALPGPLSWH